MILGPKHLRAWGFRSDITVIAARPMVLGNSTTGELKLRPGANVVEHARFARIADVYKDYLRALLDSGELDFSAIPDRPAADVLRDIESMDEQQLCKLVQIDGRPNCRSAMVARWKALRLARKVNVNAPRRINGYVWFGGEAT